jgi:hypothetical protein
MRWLFMPKLQEAKKRFFITLPGELVRKKRWEKGKELTLMFNERGNIEIFDKEM